MPTNILTQARAQELFDYDPITGNLVWKIRAAYKIKVGDIISSKCDGYIRIQIDGVSIYAHRIIYLLVTGEFPKDQIDHINGIRDDNRWLNIREVSNQENTKNQKLRITNTSGVCGVCWDKDTEKWVGRINVNGKRKFLGYFVKKQDAAKARKDAEIKYNYHPNHGKIRE